MKFQHLVTRCDLSPSSVEYALQVIEDKLGRRGWDMTIFVSASRRLIAQRVIRDMNGDVRDNPLAPYINLAFDESLAPNDWYMTVRDARDINTQMSVGSEG